MEHGTLWDNNVDKSTSYSKYNHWFFFTLKLYNVWQKNICLKLFGDQEITQSDSAHFLKIWYFKIKTVI